MATKNIFYDAVKTALIKDGWEITSDPFPINLPGLEKYDDPGRRETLAAQKGSRRIAVTIKGFIGPSMLYDFFGAVGQFINYRYALEMQSSEHLLYLAIPLDTYEEFFKEDLAQAFVHKEGINLIVFSVVKEEIVLWT